jgi:hypothetical protein
MWILMSNFAFLIPIAISFAISYVAELALPTVVTGRSNMLVELMQPLY